MKTVEAIDSDVRFTTEWDAIRRFVFIPMTRVNADAGKHLSRDEAVAFVRGRLAEYKAEAQAQHGAGNPVQMVELARVS